MRRRTSTRTGGRSAGPRKLSLVEPLPSGRPGSLRPAGRRVRRSLRQISGRGGHLVAYGAIVVGTLHHRPGHCRQSKRRRGGPRVVGYHVRRRDHAAVRAVGRDHAAGQAARPRPFRPALPINPGHAKEKFLDFRCWAMAQTHRALERAFAEKRPARITWRSISIATFSATSEHGLRRWTRCAGSALARAGVKALPASCIAPICRKPTAAPTGNIRGPPGKSSIASGGS